MRTATLLLVALFAYMHSADHGVGTDFAVAAAQAQRLLARLSPTADERRGLSEEDLFVAAADYDVERARITRQLESLTAAGTLDAAQVETAHALVVRLLNGCSERATIRGSGHGPRHRDRNAEGCVLTPVS